MHQTSEPQTLDMIPDWHRDIVDALVQRRASVQDAVRRDLRVDRRFFGMTEGEVEALYDANRRELDRLTVLNLVASAEAALKIDYFRRVDGKLKDSLSVAYREWRRTLSNRKRHRPDFDERGILDVLKKALVINNHIVGEYRACLPVRHWVGHGRHWDKPWGVDLLDPIEVYNRANALLGAVSAVV